MCTNPNSIPSRIFILSELRAKKTTWKSRVIIFYLFIFFFQNADKTQKKKINPRVDVVVPNEKNINQNQVLYFSCIFDVVVIYTYWWLVGRVGRSILNLVFLMSFLTHIYLKKTMKIKFYATLCCCLLIFLFLIFGFFFMLVVLNIYLYINNIHTHSYVGYATSYIVVVVIEMAGFYKQNFSPKKLREFFFFVYILSVLLMMPLLIICVS